MGVALGAVADDRDGLAVEEGEVCVVVVEQSPQPIARGQLAGLRPPARERRLRSLQGELLRKRQHVGDVLLRSREHSVLLDRRQALVERGGRQRLAAGRR